jgi:serine/threonine protein kinase
MINDQVNNNENELKLNNYEKIEKIGTGQFSTVYKVKNLKDGKIYAMKVIEKRPESETEEQKKQIKREINNLIKCYHWEKNYNTVHLFNNFETKDQYILIFNYCDTTLEKYINENYPNKRMPLEKIKILFLELNQGFKNLYEENVIHRDIKINNILIEYSCGDKENIIPRLADFGISRDNDTSNNPMTRSISWLLLSAPEILANGIDYSFASDLWSIGVLLYKLAFGKYPFEGNGPVELYMKIMTGPKNFEKSGDNNFDDLINRLLNKDKEKRITYEEYFNHPFFKFEEPISIINFNKKYNYNISSYTREFRTDSVNGNILLKSLSDVDFISLKELNMQFCSISDLTPLTNDNFKNLIFLNLQYNNISNLNPLKTIKFLKIREIYLGSNKITDISPLENIPFKCLKKLGLAYNPLKWDKECERIYNSIISI